MTRAIRFVILGVLLVALLAVVTAQAPASSAAAPAPVLAEVDRLKLINAFQALEIATLKFQGAAADLQRTRDAAEKLVAAAAVPGWQLNDKLEYVKAPAGGKDQ